MNGFFGTLVRTLSRHFNASSFFSRGAKARLQKNLLQAALPFEAGEYLSFSFALPALSALAALVFFALSGVDFLEGFAFSLFLFALAFFALIRYPAAVARSRAKRIERDLSVALRAMHVSMLFNSDFEKSLQLVARNGASERGWESRRERGIDRGTEFGRGAMGVVGSSGGAGSFGELSSEFSRVLSDVRHGAPVVFALQSFASRVDSVHAKRAAMQLAFTYEHGLKGEGLRRLADELSSMQRADARRFAAKTAFSGLLFIAASSIIPAFFSAYAAVGSLFLDTQVSPGDVVVAFVLVFPAISGGILLFIKSQMPPSISSE